MKFALVGKNIAHSMSPSLYREIFACKIQYDLIDVKSDSDLPTLLELAQHYDGINITSPYKKFYISQVELDSPEVKKLGAINTISFTPKGMFATNTDLIAVKTILSRYLKEMPHLYLTILGSGVMSKLTMLLAQDLHIPFEIIDRKSGLHSHFDLSSHYLKQGHVIINACSRDFAFQGKLHEKSIFWDYNYRFLPHQSSLPSRVFSYQDGQEMLTLQAKAAAEFWLRTNPKLKC